MRHSFNSWRLAACLMLAASAQAAPQFTLADGATLTLDKHALRLADRAGKELASLPLRAKQLDVRGDLAVVLDGATQHLLPVRIDRARGSLTPLPPLPQQAFGVESLCLYHDRQGLDHVFIGAKDGQAEQWLLSGAAPRLVRKLSLPPDAKQCRVDDARHRLLVTEPGIGDWAYEADSEATPRRSLLKPGAGAPAQAPEPPIAVIAPRVQTEMVARLGDVADDPAIWVHPTDATLSRVLGTNKKQGLMVYDLQGRQQQFLQVGRLNNVDLRQGVLFDGVALDIAVATQRDDNTLLLFAIDGDGKVSEVARIPSGFDEIYGVCLFQPRSGGLDVIVNDKGGVFRQFQLARQGGVWRGRVAREFKVASQPEGCVADDRNERLFIGEEKRAVWTLDARAGKSAAMRQVLAVGPQLHADVEGMAIYQGAGGAYLIVSSQGDSSYVVLDAQAPYRVRGRFKVGFNLAAGIDGTSETDGLDVTAHDLGGPFAKGMLVIQDGYKRLPDGPQNFKYLSWDDVAQALRLPP